MVDETGLDEPKVDATAVDEIAVDEPGPHQYDYTACMHAWLSPNPFVKRKWCLKCSTAVHVIC